MRLGPRCAISVDEDHILISFNGVILNYCISKNSYLIEHRFDRGMKNPLSFCKYTNKAGNKEILYGEYIWNVDKGPVAIYKRYLDEWEKVFEFEYGTITHIHNIIFDEYREQFIILTGDEDKESGIWIADLDFKSVKPLLIGSQKYRACIAFPMQDCILYATDTPKETNHLYRVSSLEKDAPEVETICELPGPCIYGTKNNGAYYLSTTVEPDSTLPTWKYRTTHKLGKGVKDYHSYLFEIDQNGNVSEIASFKKDCWPIWLFQFGNLLFPYNETRKLYVTTQSVKPKSGITLCN